MDTGEKKIPAATIADKPSIFSFHNISRCFYIAGQLLCAAILLELIVAGFVLEAPVKVLGFWVILLFVGTVVPRRYGKYIYVLFLIVLTCITVWTFRSDSDGSWRVVRFDKESAALRSDVDGPNAADLYLPLLESYNGETFHPNIYDFEYFGLDFTDAYSTQAYPELAKMVHSYDDIIEKLLEACRIDRCDFSVPADMQEIKFQHRRIAVMKCWARLLLNSANNDIGEGFIDRAIEKQFAVLKMADHLYQQRTVFDNSGAIHIELIAMENINSLVMNHCVDTSQLDRIAEKLDPDDEYFPDNWDHIYDSFRLIAKNTVGLLYEERSDGKTRRSHNIAPTLNHHFSAKMRITPYHMSIVKAGAVGHWFVLPRTPLGAAKIIDAAFEEYSPTVNPDNLTKGKPGFKLNYKYACRQGAYYCAKFYYAIRTQSRRRASAARSSRILIELKRYYLLNGSWPEDIGDMDGLDPRVLVDTVNDLPFVYKPYGESFLLYSVGRNEIDDNSIAFQQRGWDDIRYWPAKMPELE